MVKWTLGRRITALCAVVGLLLTLIAMATASTAVASRERARTLMEQVGPLRTDSGHLLTVLVDQQTAVRGYALIGSDNVLTPYHDGVAEEKRLITEMRGLTRDPAVLARLSELEARAAAWRTDIAERAISATRAGRAGDAQAILSTAGGSRFDEVRASATALRDRTSVLRDAATEQTRGALRLLVALLVLAVIVVVVAGLAVTLLLRRLVISPVVNLAGEVRRVARGEYERKIEVEGPPEVVRLAEDINAMRQQILADLGTVRQAHLQLEEANRLLEQQAEELSRSNRDLEQFAYVASHDLQEPLRKVASFCQLLQRRYAGQLDERADQYIAFAVDGAQRMQRLINDLLAFSRIGRMTSGFTEVDLDRVVADAAAQLSWRAEQVDGAITWSDLPTVRGEEPLLSALFTNLISNSFKFRHPDRAPEVRVSAERVGDEWHISVADNGIGVEPAYADKIFVIFQRLHPKNEYPGTGIGLAIAKKIIEYHGGRIWLDTEAREGTVIRIVLPAVVPADPLQPEHAPTDLPAVLPAAPDQPALIPAAADGARTEETGS
ncbi:HAMP domain-containing protein [Planosporangium flavigriseum]|uniref:histidine kinase n=1 Tax=Planosporangium flavigriseum TaxID=373681 RepID=A0A8J3LU28_9ACTN|nr:sensor histidine kinase [Planosporangium flavigriseum]NJC66764.1 HAMP domain-containing protein [Planosporangium flavigriseum]GIG76558.1 histidine kinase [Planosporangium flavigriseum]